jgi:hypothetical protein
MIMAFIASLLPVFVAVALLLGVAIAAMMIGQRLSGRCLRGSCGGPKAVGPDGAPIRCVGCPNAAEAGTDESRGSGDR